NMSFLGACSVDADCVPSLGCVCGVCSRPCADETACEGLGASAACGAAPPPSSCDVPRYCVAEADAGAGAGAGGARGDASAGLPVTIGADGWNVVAPPDSARACAASSDCELVDQFCCASAARIRAGDLWAVNADQVEPYHRAHSEACVAAGWSDCSLSMGSREREATAVCVAGTCESVDIRDAADVTACRAHDECQLRSAGCCACGEDRAEAIAVSSSAAYDRLACDPGVECAPCGLRPTAARAVCEGGVCTVLFE
ncbi:MAG: hypothetical protein FJ104_08350, partial [Deltaproteobacteria bacterium]|nr:hypothetical protein [Deltaproteobacteria bacterium]